MAAERHVIYAAREAGWFKRLLLVVEMQRAAGRTPGTETAGFVEEQQSRPAHPLVVRSESLGLDHSLARYRGNPGSSTPATSGVQGDAPSLPEACDPRR
jgi:hypothetical protein